MEAARVPDFLLEERLPVSATDPALDCDMSNKFLRFQSLRFLDCFLTNIV